MEDLESPPPVVGTHAPRCPECGSDNTSPIAWGLVYSPDDVPSGHYIGGCCIVTDEHGNDARWHCYGCGHNWGAAPSP